MTHDPPRSPTPWALALPDHLLAAVFAAADDSDLPALRLTCRAFLRPANEATKALKLRRPGCVRLADFPGLREVDASEAAAAGEWTQALLEDVAEQVGGWVVVRKHQHAAGLSWGVGWQQHAAGLPLRCPGPPI